MGFDDVREWNGERYSGVRVGGGHRWDYPDGEWRERKVAPDRWTFTFRSTKRRQRAAPEGSGAAVGTQYHWHVSASQRVRKVDANTYETLMEGLKYKVAHKRPHWRRWSSEYPGNPSARERTIEVLEDALARLRAEGRRERALEFRPALDVAEEAAGAGRRQATLDAGLYE